MNCRKCFETWINKITANWIWNPAEIGYFSWCAHKEAAPTYFLLHLSSLQSRQTWNPPQNMVKVTEKTPPDRLQGKNQEESCIDTSYRENNLISCGLKKGKIRWAKILTSMFLAGTDCCSEEKNKIKWLWPYLPA